MTSDPAFSATAAARRVLATAATGALATLGPEGGPFASLVTVGTTVAGEPVLLLSRLAVHTRNLAADRRASILLVAPGGEDGDPLAGARLTVEGSVAGPVDDPDARRRFLARHPEAEAYAGFGDFGFYRLVIARAHLVAGFGRIVTLPREALLHDLSDAEGAVAAEAEIVAHLNADHADTLSLYATRLLGEAAGPWRAVAADPDGIELAAGRRRARLDYPERATSPGAVRAVLVRLAEEARRR